MVETYRDNRSAPPDNSRESRRLTRTPPRQGTRVPRTIRIRKNSQGITVRFTAGIKTHFHGRVQGARHSHFKPRGKENELDWIGLEAMGIGSRVILETI